MGFSDKSTNSVNYIKIKWLGKAEDMHFFEVNWEQIPQKTFEGKMVKISNAEYEFEGKIRKTFKILFVDNAIEYYQLDISFTNLSRWLLNSVLWYIETQKKIWKNKWKINLEMSLYINKDWYKQLGLKINWDRADWLLSYEEQKHMITETKLKNWDVIREFDELDNFYIWKIDEIQDFISVDDFIQEIKEVKKETKNLPQEEINIEDIPF